MRAFYKQLLTSNKVSGTFKNIYTRFLKDISDESSPILANI